MKTETASKWKLLLTNELRKLYAGAVRHPDHVASVKLRDELAVELARRAARS